MRCIVKDETKKKREEKGVVVAGAHRYVALALSGMHDDVVIVEVDEPGHINW